MHHLYLLQTVCGRVFLLLCVLYYFVLAGIISNLLYLIATIHVIYIAGTQK